MTAQGFERSIQGRVRVRLILPCVGLMLLSSLDRVNISFAALQMNHDLGLSPQQYGFGAGIFFLGYLAGQYPSLLLQKLIGTRRWLTLCALIWGSAAAGMAFINSAEEFWVLRVVLGLAEAGLAAGIMLYLCQWTTPEQRASTIVLPMLAIPVSAVAGAPLSGWLLSVGTPFGMPSWRWMLLVEGLPTLLAGACAFFYFPDHPGEAKWLSAAERDWLARNNAVAPRAASVGGSNSLHVLRDPVIWMSAGVWFGLLAGAYGLMFWLPQVVQQWTGYGAFTVSLISAVPWVGVGLGMWVNAWHSDRTQERFWHIGAPALLAGIAIASPMFFGSHLFASLALLVAGCGLGAAQGAFWAMPIGCLQPRSLMMGIATINIAGSSAGLVVPHIIGWVRENTGSFVLPVYLVAITLFAAAVIVAMIRLAVGQRAALLPVAEGQIARRFQ